jgi:hypothetical protein
MVTRGYEGEEKEKGDYSIKTLTCAGCHYGPNGPTGQEETGRTAVTAFPTTEMGGRKAAPRPVHKGLPTLHFDVLSCTACHSGPFPSEQATRVLTSMAHRLGSESYNRVGEAAPAIEQPVFLRVTLHDDVKKIVPHKMFYPTFWGRQNGDAITPIAPDLLNTKALQKLFGPKPTLDLQPPKPLTEDEIVKILDAIEAMEPPKPATTQPTTTAASVPAYFRGNPVFITGGKAFRRDGKGKLTSFDHDAAKPYAWPLAHDVRGAQQALGARGCTDCHASNAPLFDSTVSSNAVLTSAIIKTPMSRLRGDTNAASMAAFAATYPMRPMLIATGYTCAVLLALVLIAYTGRAVAASARRRW